MINENFQNCSTDVQEESNGKRNDKNLLCETFATLTKRLTKMKLKHASLDINHRTPKCRLSLMETPPSHYYKSYDSEESGICSSTSSFSSCSIYRYLRTADEQMSTPIRCSPDVFETPRNCLISLRGTSEKCSGRRAVEIPKVRISPDVLSATTPKCQLSIDNGGDPKHRPNQSAQLLTAFKSDKKGNIRRNQTFSEGDLTDSDIFFCKYGSDRTLWRDLKETIQTGILATLDQGVLMTQEKIFEIVSTEATYLHKVDILVEKFYMSPKLSGDASSGSVISRRQRDELFGNIADVQRKSNNLFHALYASVKSYVMLDQVFNVLADHLERAESTLVTYCSCLAYQQKVLGWLKSTNHAFADAVEKIEMKKYTAGQTLNSFLMQPLQRVTRYPLLIEAILKDLPANDDKYKSVSRALQVANRLVARCNDTTKCFQELEHLIRLENLLVYKSSSPKRFPLVSQKRRFIMRDAFNAFVAEQKRNWVICELFLFNDVLLLTKPSRGRFVVKDYFKTSALSASCFDANCENKSCSEFAFYCAVNENNAGLKVDLVLSSDTKETKRKWLIALKGKFCAHCSARLVGGAQELAINYRWTLSSACCKSGKSHERSVYCTTPRKSKLII